MALRSLSENDLTLVLDWRNAPQVRGNMYASHKITWEEHRAWFHKMQHDPHMLWYMYTQNNIPFGVVYFTSYQPERRNACWGFYAGSNAPRGTGLRMEYAALEHAFSKLGLHKLNCEVIVFNKAVINMHKKCGFKEEGVFRDFHYDGEHYHDVVRMGMLGSEWIECRDKLAGRISKLP